MDTDQKELLLQDDSRIYSELTKADFFAAPVDKKVQILLAVLDKAMEESIKLLTTNGFKVKDGKPVLPWWKLGRKEMDDKNYQIWNAQSELTKSVISNPAKTLGYSRGLYGGTPVI